MITAAIPETTQKKNCDLSNSKNNRDPERILQARGMNIRYAKGPDIVRDADIEIRRGLVTMILGRSGSGKTTLLRGLSGLIALRQGTLDWYPDSREANSSRYPRIAYIPQNLGLLKEMTALENTLIGSLRETGGLKSLFKIFPAERVARARELLTLLGIADKMDIRVSRLSGGQRQRVAIARALIQEPQLILADEFVSQLDAVTAGEILQMTRTLSGQGISFLVTTHDTGLVHEYADEVVIMNAGKIVFAAASREISGNEMLGKIK